MPTTSGMPDGLQRRGGVPAAAAEVDGLPRAGQRLENAGTAARHAADHHRSKPRAYPALMRPE